MDSFFPSPLSTDSVDKLNYKWTFSLLLVISLATLVIPQHPLFQVATQPSHIMKSLHLPKVQVKCVPPADGNKEGFSLSETSYANVHCANAFNRAINGLHSTSVNELLRNNVRHSLPKHAKYIKKYLGKYEGLRKTLEKYTTIKALTRHMIVFKTPSMLLACAIGVTLPQFIWTLLAEFSNSVNIGKTLENAREETFRKKVIDGRTFIGPTRTASYMYLIKKFLAIVTAVIILTLTRLYTEQTLVRLQEDMEECQNSLLTFPKSIDLSSFFQAPNDTFICLYRKLATSKTNKLSQSRVQCIVIEVEHAVFKRSSVVDSMRHEDEFMEFESLVFLVVVTTFYILLIINVISFLSWVYSLVYASRRKTYGLTSETPMDLILLVHMARINTGADVLENITQSVNEDFKNFKLTVNDSAAPAIDPPAKKSIESNTL